MDFGDFSRDSSAPEKFWALPQESQREVLARIHQGVHKPAPKVPRTLGDEERRALPKKPREEQLRGFRELTAQRALADKELVQKLNAQIENAQKQLEAATQAKDTFLARLVHEDEGGAYAAALGADVFSLQEEAEKLFAASQGAPSSAAAGGTQGLSKEDLHAFIQQTVRALWAQQQQNAGAQGAEAPAEKPAAEVAASGDGGSVGGGDAGAGGGAQGAPEGVETP